MKKVLVSALTGTAAIIALSSSPASANDEWVQINGGGATLAAAKYDDLTDTVCVKNFTNQSVDTWVYLRNAAGRIVHSQHAEPGQGWSCSRNLSIPEDAPGWRMQLSWAGTPSNGSKYSDPFFT